VNDCCRKRKNRHLILSFTPSQTCELSILLRYIGAPGADGGKGEVLVYEQQEGGTWDVTTLPAPYTGVVGERDFTEAPGWGASLALGGDLLVASALAPFTTSDAELFYFVMYKREGPGQWTVIDASFSRGLALQFPNVTLAVSARGTE
jgi:hypothetical protein